MTREEAIKFASHAQSLTDLPEVKEFYALAESALREQEEREKPQPLTLEIQNLDLRQIVLRALMSLEDQYTQTHSLMTVNVADYICQSIEKSIDKNERRWIPVAERLPEDDLPKNSKRRMIRCPVATDKGTVKPCVRQRYEKKIDGKWQMCAWEWNKDLYAKPTHWMPLPQPPKGE